MGRGPHTTGSRARRGEREGEREGALHHVTAVDVLTLSHGLSESYSPRTQCSSCISVCLLSLEHGAEMGLELRELHLDTRRAPIL